MSLRCNLCQDGDSQRRDRGNHAETLLARSPAVRRRRHHVGDHHQLERIGWRGVGRTDDYLFASVGFCCRGVDSTYQIRYGCATSISGPYLDKSGIDILQGGGTLLDSGNQRWIGSGGQDIAGTHTIARHAYDATDNGAPKLLIDTLYWDAQGWPTY
jgi:hypothetical protein